jgi:hypothetical protein
MMRKQEKKKKIIFTAQTFQKTLNNYTSTKLL